MSGDKEEKSQNCQVLRPGPESLVLRFQTLHMRTGEFCFKLGQTSIRSVKANWQITMCFLVHSWLFLQTIYQCVNCCSTMELVSRSQMMVL